MMKRNQYSLLVITILMLALLPVTLVSSAVTGVTEPSGTTTVGPSGTYTLEWTGDWSGTTGFGGATVTINIPGGSGFTYAGYDAFDSSMTPFVMTPTASHDPGGTGQVQITTSTPPVDVNTIQVHFTAPATAGGPFTFAGNSLFASDDFPPIDDFTQDVSVVGTYAVSLDTATSTLSELTGTPIVHTITVTNDGNVPDDFTLSYVGDGSAAFSPVSPLSLAVSASQAVDITMSGLSDGANAGTFTATSVGDGGETASATLNSFVETTGVTLAETITTSPVVGSLDQDVIHTITITNTGNIADTFDLTVDAGDTGLFGTNPIVGLAAGTSTDFTFTHEDNPGHGGVDYSKTATLRATSQTVGATTTTLAGVESQFKNYAVEVTPVDPTDSVLVGDPAVVYTFTVENTGGLQDSYDVTVTGDGTLSVSRIENLDPAATTTFTLTHSTAAAVTLVETVKVESDFDAGIFDESTATTKVATYGVTVTDPSSETIVSGDDAVHTITVTNTGSHEDTFDLSYVGDLAPAPSDTSVTLASGANTDVTVTYTAPADGVHTGVFTAESTEIPVGTATDTSALTTTVKRFGVTLSDPGAQAFLKNTVASLTIDIDNTGNYADTFTLNWTGTPVGTPSVGEITVAAGGSDTFTLSLSGNVPGASLSGTLTATSQEAPILGSSADDSVTIDSNVKDYAFTVDMLFSGRRLVEIGGTATHPFDFTSNTNQGTAAYTVSSTYGSASPGALTQVSVGFDLDIEVGDTAVAGTFDGVVTVASVEDPRETESFTTRTWVTDPANHESETGIGTGVYDHSGTIGLSLDLTSAGTHDIDLWKLTVNPDNELPEEVALYYGAFQIDDPTGITAFHVTVEIPEDTLGDSDIDAMDAFLLTPEGTWYSATSGDFNYDKDLDQADFSIIAANWNSYGSDYVVFSIAAEEEFAGLPPALIIPPTPPVPDVEVPEDATPDEVGDAILDAITDDTTTDVIADIIVAETEGSSNEDVAEVILTVVEDSTTEETAEIVADVVEDLEVSDTVEVVEAIIEEATTEEVAVIVAEVVADRPVEEAAEIVAEIVADETVEEAAEVILEVIEERPVEEQAEIIVEQQPEQAAVVVEQLEVEEAVDIIEEAVQAGSTEEIAAVVNDVEPEVVAEVLLHSDPQLAAEVVNKMAGEDLNSAAVRVEEVVKKKVGEVDEAKSAEYEEQIDSIVTASLTEEEKAQALVDLFIEIANLPATPSTVAEVFEIIGLEKTMEVVTIWVEKGAYSELAMVYSYLTTETLADVYTAMTTAARTAVFPYFDAATLGNLPELTTFTVDVEVNPSTVETGEPVTVTATITNIGDETGDLVVTMTEGSSEESEIVTLEAGESTELTWTITKSTAGSYSVDVNGESASWTVESPPTPAAFETSNLAVTPATIRAGEDVTVTVDIENVGEESGSTTVSVELDGAEVDSELVTLDGGASTTVSFTVTSETEGAHTVEVDGESASFTVEAAPTGFPMSYLIIGVVIVAVAAYLYMQQQNREE